jgi:hypothetical protein
MLGQYWCISQELPLIFSAAILSVATVAAAGSIGGQFGVDRSRFPVGLAWFPKYGSSRWPIGTGHL